MQTQIVSLAKDMYGISIPKKLSQELGFMAGYKVITERGEDGNSLVIRPVKNATMGKSKYGSTSKEFDRWLELVTKEDAGIIKELAKC